MKHIKIYKKYKRDYKKYLIVYKPEESYLVFVPNYSRPPGQTLAISKDEILIYSSDYYRIKMDKDVKKFNI